MNESTERVGPGKIYIEHLDRILGMFLNIIPFERKTCHYHSRAVETMRS